MTPGRINPTLTFEIKSSVDLLNILLEEYEDFDRQHLNPRFAMNCAITSWHLTDWTYQEYHRDDPMFADFKLTDTNGKEKIITGLMKYQQSLILACPELEFMRLITNGLKHCVLNNIGQKTKTLMRPGDFSSDFSRHDFDVPQYVIDLGKNKSVNFETALLSTIYFWKIKLRQNLS